MSNSSAVIHQVVIELKSSDSSAQSGTKNVIAAVTNSSSNVLSQTLAELIIEKLPDKLLQEYWQLRQELRDRLNSQRSILLGAVTAYAAVVGAIATLLSPKDPNFFAVGLLSLVPHAFLLPAFKLILAEHASIITIARYLRTHIELPFFDTATTHSELGKASHVLPLGWESTMLVHRLAAQDLKNPAVRQQIQAERDRSGHSTEAPDSFTGLWGAGTQSAAEGTTTIPTAYLSHPANEQAIRLTDERDQLSRSAFTQIFRAFSVMSSIMTGVFLGLGYFFRRSLLNESIPNGWVQLTLAILIVAAAVGLPVWMYRLAGRYKQLCTPQSYWDAPGLETSAARALIERFRSPLPIKLKDGRVPASTDQGGKPPTQ